jgi:cytochrome c oxidase subunit 2
MDENMFEASTQLPPALSTWAAETDWLFYFIFWVSVVFFVGIVGAMLYFMVKYRRRPCSS